MVALSLRDDAVVAGVAGGQLGDDAEADRVVVAAGDQAPRASASRARSSGSWCSAGRRWRCGRAPASGSRRRRCDGAPKPTSSVMISSTLGAPLGGTDAGQPEAVRSPAPGGLICRRRARAAAPGSAYFAPIEHGSVRGARRPGGPSPGPKRSQEGRVHWRAEERLIAGMGRLRSWAATLPGCED